eukprot:SAG31_NODE_82_length_27046_cov_45.857275_15_plen_167_part_00
MGCAWQLPKPKFSVSCPISRTFHRSNVRMCVARGTAALIETYHLVLDAVVEVGVDTWSGVRRGRTLSRVWRVAGQPPTSRCRASRWPSMPRWYDRQYIASLDQGTIYLNNVKVPNDETALNANIKVLTCPVNRYHLLPNGENGPRPNPGFGASQWVPACTKLLRSV